MTKLRRLSLFIATCAGGLMLYNSQSGLHPLVRDCMAANTRQTVIDSCQTALASDVLTPRERGHVTFALGYRHHRDTDPQIAVDYYSQTIAIYPAKTSAFYNRGLLHNDKTRDFDTAIGDFTAVIDQMQAGGPDYPDVYGQRGYSYRKDGQIDLALADYNRHLETNPDDAWAWRQRSWAKGRLGDKDGALSDINQAMALGANTAWTWYQRGWLRRDAQDFEGALADLNKAITISPDYRLAKRARTQLISDAMQAYQDSPAQLLTFVTQALDNDLDSVAFLELRATIHAETGQLPAALRDINRAIQLQRLPQQSQLIRASIYAHVGQTDRAFDDLGKVIADTAADSALMQNLRAERDTLFATDRMEEGDQITRQIERLHGLADNALRARSQLHQTSGNTAAAIADYNTIITKDPDDARHLTGRGDLMTTLGRADDAIADYTRALLLIDTGTADPFSPKAELPAQILLKRGALHQAAGDDQAALADFEAALAYDNANLIAAFQEKMRRAGHHAGPMTDTLDAATRAALPACAADPAC